MEKTSLKLGFVALLDAAPLLVAYERGFFAEQGLSVTLARQPSWAALRDKLAVGALDGAQILAPMTIASALGLGGLSETIISALALNLGGNAVTLSAALMARIAAIDPVGAQKRPLDARLLKAAITELDRAPVFAVVHPFSGHHYELRLWLASGGIDADREVELVIVPPAHMLSRLSADSIDGYCVGEPWNLLAARSGLGQVAVTSRDLWAGRIEKMFGVLQSWADQNPETHRALLRALLLAAIWADQPENRAELAEILARPCYVNAPVAPIRMLLEGANPPRFHRSAANFPWRSQGHWYLAQMQRWGQTGPVADLRRLIEQLFRCDLARLAYLDLGLAVPTIDSKVEGGHREAWTLTAATQPIAMDADGFLFGPAFDPSAANPAVTMSRQGEL